MRSATIALAVGATLVASAPALAADDPPANVARA
jgi:hypothetical protein